jgi:hypothetical protein
MVPQTQIIAFDAISAFKTKRIDPEVTGSSQIIRANGDPAPGS